MALHQYVFATRTFQLWLGMAGGATGIDATRHGDR
jgi:hypothetical protein